MQQALRPTYPSDSGLNCLWGLLLSLALNDISFETFFSDAPDAPDQTAPFDSYIRHSQEQLISLRNPEAINILFDLYTEIIPPGQTSYLVFRTIERIVAVSHRNQAMMNSLGLGGPVFEYFSRNRDLLLTECTRLVAQKLLRRLLEMGVPSLEQSRRLFQNVLKDSTVDSNALTLLRSSSRAKWPSFFSFSHASSLVLPDTRGKAFPPPNGFTYMVRISAWFLSYSFY